MSTLLELKGASKFFGGIKAVNDVTFSIEEGEILGLIGPNGSGKSTCVNLIAGVYDLTAGEIVFQGKPLTPKIDVKDRSRMGIGRTFQTPRPFGHLSVYDNVFSVALLSNSFADAHKKTEHVLSETGLAQYSAMLSAKLPIEKRKWLDLARVLATDPKLVMMDEVMAGLTGNEMDSSLELVRKINRENGITVLFIEHVMKAVLNVCGRVVVLNQGQLLAQGEPKTVLEMPEVVEAYIGGPENA